MKIKIFIIVLLAAAMVSFTMVKSGKASKNYQHASVGADRNMADKDQFN